MYRDRLNWKQVAWNGVRFQTPAEWEAAQIGSRHLILENKAGPVMEVKWGPVKGAFSHETQLKRLTALHSKKVKGRIVEWFLPPHWETVLADFETSGFLWQEESAIGRGVILFCPSCRNAAMIQFFQYHTAEHEKLLWKVLKTYRDHGQDDRIFWSIFDIRAILPEELKLQRYRFEAGKFELAFIDGRQTLHLHRWAPAATLLNGRDLIGFIRTIPEFEVGQPHSLTVNDSAKVEWSIFPGSGWLRKMSRFKLRPSYYWFRLWHLTEKNRILSVRAQSKQPLDFQLLDQICTDYESL